MLTATRKPSWRDTMHALDLMALNARQARDAEEARRELLQIKARDLPPPRYDNSDLLILERWTVNNLAQLVDYFSALCVTPDEYPTMVRIQYERQLALRELIPPRERDHDQEAVDRYERLLLARSDVHEQSGIKLQGSL